MTTYVSVNVARLLKKRGYPQDPVIYRNSIGIHYYRIGKLYPHNLFRDFASDYKDITEHNIEYYIAPSQADALQWLRDRYRIHVFIIGWGCTTKGYRFAVKIQTTDFPDGDYMEDSFDTYNHAEDAALTEVLTYLQYYILQQQGACIDEEEKYKFKDV